MAAGDFRPGRVVGIAEAVLKKAFDDYLEIYRCRDRVNREFFCIMFARR
jgi:hypothetical protein